jgi:hypothetical protein
VRRDAADDLDHRDHEIQGKGDQKSCARCVIRMRVLMRATAGMRLGTDAAFHFDFRCLPFTVAGVLSQFGSPSDLPDC